MVLKIRLIQRSLPADFVHAKWKTLGGAVVPGIMVLLQASTAAPRTLL